MVAAEALRHSRISLAHGTGAIPAPGFGTLIPDLGQTKQATTAALEVGFRHLDGAERYQNEEAVGAAIHEAIAAGTVRREDLFVTTKLWNTNHRPERVRPAFDEAECSGRPGDHRHRRAGAHVAAQVALSWAAQRGTAFLTTSTKPQRIKENFEISTLPEEAMQAIRDRITTNIRFNSVVNTGVPGFIPSIK
ncbi:diketogulonate reductase-like aldo/keto reductase [Mycobacterium sp. MAA66]|uniref:aldo/keto reductase n=1 Tax=Mycobacterium sp. MAA66 TaxID=3156297 RepID=UPI0035111694